MPSAQNASVAENIEKAMLAAAAFNQLDGLTSIEAGARPEITQGHEVYILSLDDIEARGLEGAVFSGLRFLVSVGPSVVGAVEIPVGDSGAPLLQQSRFDDNIASTLRRVGDAAEDFRLLKVNALYLWAIWLPRGTDRVIVPLNPSPAYLEPGRIYSELEFIDILRRADIRPSDRPR